MSQEEEEVAVIVAKEMMESKVKTEVRAVEVEAAVAVVEIAKMEAIVAVAEAAEEEVMENTEVVVEEADVVVVKESGVKVSTMKKQILMALLMLLKPVVIVKDMVARLAKMPTQWIAFPEQVVEEVTGKKVVTEPAIGVTKGSLWKKVRKKRREKEKVMMPMKKAKARAKDVKEDHVGRKRK